MAIYRQNNSVEMFGLKEIQQLFRQLPEQVNKNKIWVKLFRQVSKPLIQKAKSLAPKKTGQLSRSIGFFTTKASRRYNGGYVGPRVKGAFAKRDKEYKGSNKKKIYTKSGFYGAWVEYGNEVMFGGKATGQAQKFMKPAYEQTKDLMLNNIMKDSEIIMARAIKSHEKRMQKYGKFGY
jgi:HK97 gp10 family phage protein